MNTVIVVTGIICVTVLGIAGLVAYIFGKALDTTKENEKISEEIEENRNA